MRFFIDHGILGINARNLLYIRPFNPKKAIRFADDKLKTKHFLSARGIPTPRLYSAIHNTDELDRFDFSSLPDSFVLKPNLGYGGEGIIVVVDRKDGFFLKASGELISAPELSEHISDILEGRFSISELQDTAFFEQLILCDPSMAQFTTKGLPDIRIVLHNLIPVMAMLRLPTKESDGKANLHQGAVGVGIDMATGKATHIVYKNKIVQEIPGLGPIQGFKIPYWDEILLIASNIQLNTNLGYCAVDIAIDENNGPLLLEINARAGLSVQMANLAPLRRRLERIQGVHVTTPEKGVRVAQDLFGNKVGKEDKKTGGKEIVGYEEQVKILAPTEARYIWASLNPLLEESVLDKNLAKELKLYDKKEESVKVKFLLGTIRVQTLLRLEDLSGQDFLLVLGKRDLKEVLIDPNKGKSKSLKLPALPSLAQKSKSKLNDLDLRIVTLDKEMKLLSHLKPVNLNSEKAKFLKSTHYNPKFEYRSLSFNVEEMKVRFGKLKESSDDTLIGKLLSGKIRELEKKFELLKARGSSLFTDLSVSLYGSPGSHLISKAREKINQKPKQFVRSEVLYSTAEAVLFFERIFKEYGLDHWKVKINKNMVAACSSGKQNTLFIREGAEFFEDRLRMLVAHEIETHILTAENGKYQALHLFNRGFEDYLETQEGLAIWNQEQVLSHDSEKNYRSAILVFLVEFALKHSFAETYDYALKLGLPQEKALQTALKLKRGLEDTSRPGAFTKELCYFSGYLQIEDFVGNGGDLRDLYFGKFNLRDLETIKKIPDLNKPKILPKFLFSSL